MGRGAVRICRSRRAVGSVEHGRAVGIVCDRGAVRRCRRDGSGRWRHRGARMLVWRARVDRWGRALAGVDRRIGARTGIDGLARRIGVDRLIGRVGVDRLARPRVVAGVAGPVVVAGVAAVGGWLAGGAGVGAGGSGVVAGVARSAGVARVAAVGGRLAAGTRIWTRAGAGVGARALLGVGCGSRLGWARVGPGVAGAAVVAGVAAVGGWLPTAAGVAAGGSGVVSGVARAAGIAGVAAVGGRLAAGTRIWTRARAGVGVGARAGAGIRCRARICWRSRVDRRRSARWTGIDRRWPRVVRWRRRIGRLRVRWCLRAVATRICRIAAVAGVIRRYDRPVAGRVAAGRRLRTAPAGADAIVDRPLVPLGRNLVAQVFPVSEQHAGSGPGRHTGALPE